MAKLECFAIEGIEMWFFSNDHSPPHFHAKRRGRWEVRVNFLESATSKMFTLVWLRVREVPRADTKLLEGMVNAHRIELLEEWEMKVKLQ
jgi:hypothetical protein